MKNLLIIFVLLLAGLNGFGQDTTIIIGQDPAYTDTIQRFSRDLRDKLTPGVYLHYHDDCWNNKKRNKSYPRIEKCKGQLVEECIYGADSLITYRQFYYYDISGKSLVPRGIINYKDGVWNGIVIDYNSNRTINSIGSYKDGEKHGNWFYLGSKGTEPVESIYINGEYQND
tara:strand:+ start:318 stop:830 length:513 start_codon:yes stop_codon:yes gene_type:complete